MNEPVAQHSSTGNGDRFLRTAVVLVLVVQAATLGVLIWQGSGVRSVAQPVASIGFIENEHKPADIPRKEIETTFALLDEPPPNVTGADRALRWYAVGEDALALVSTMSMVGPGMGSARFKISDHTDVLMVSEGESLPTRTPARLLRVFAGRVEIEMADRRYDVLADGLTAPLPSSTSGTAPPARPLPSDPVAPPSVNASGTPEWPRDPRAADPAATPPPKADTYDIALEEWPRFVEWLGKSMAADAVFKDDLDWTGTPRGALIASTKDGFVLTDFGVGKNDVIVSFQGLDVDSARSLREIVGLGVSSDRVTLTVRRGDAERDVVVLRAAR